MGSVLRLLIPAADLSLAARGIFAALTDGVREIPKNPASIDRRKVAGRLLSPRRRVIGLDAPGCDNQVRTGQAARLPASGRKTDSSASDGSRPALYRRA